jgi:hypothetical protein
MNSNVFWVITHYSSEKLRRFGEHIASSFKVERTKTRKQEAGLTLETILDEFLTAVSTKAAVF